MTQREQKYATSDLVREVVKFSDAAQDAQAAMLISSRRLAAAADRLESKLDPGEVSVQPKANKLPRADESGKLAAGWLPDALSGQAAGQLAKAQDVAKEAQGKANAAQSTASLAQSAADAAQSAADAAQSTADTALAKAEAAKVSPDPATLTLNAAGQLTALGGNLAYNEEVWILASGTFTAPVTGWYDVLTFGGGGNGTVGAYFAGASVKLISGRTGEMHGGPVYLRQGEEVEVIIGAGAPPGPAGNSASSKDGGNTSFGNKTLAYLGRLSAEIRVYSLINASRDITLYGIGLDGGYPSIQPASISQSEKNAYCNAVRHFGGSGAVRFTTISDYGAGAGAQGSVRLRYWNPDKANG